MPNLSGSQGGAWAPGQLVCACGLTGPASSLRPQHAPAGRARSGSREQRVALADTARAPRPGAAWERPALIKRGGKPAGARLPPRVAGM